MELKEESLGKKMEVIRRDIGDKEALKEAID